MSSMVAFVCINSLCILSNSDNFYMQNNYVDRYGLKLRIAISANKPAKVVVFVLTMHIAS